MAATWPIKVSLYVLKQLLLTMYRSYFDVHMSVHRKFISNKGQAYGLGNGFSSFYY